MRTQTRGGSGVAHPGYPIQPHSLLRRVGGKRGKESRSGPRTVSSRGLQQGHSRRDPHVVPSPQLYQMLAVNSREQEPQTAFLISHRWEMFAPESVKQ